MRPSHARDLEVAALASRQHGVVTHAQLLECGLSADAIKRRARTGRLHRLYRGVYAVGHRALSPDGRLLAAALSCGAGAVLSHRTAAHLWDLRRSSAARIDVTIPGDPGRRPRVGIRLHRSATLHPEHVTTLRGLPVTTPSRTLFDLAAAVPPRQLERALEEAEVQRQDVGAGLAALLGAHPTRAGTRNLRAALARHHADPTLTRSDLEDNVLELCDDHGLPRPAVNVGILGHEVDFLWPDRRLVLEADGFAYHRTREAFERDRRRDAHLLAHGYRVVRVTHRRLTAEPAAVANVLRRVLLGDLASGR
jgi:hypothetical protein